MAAYLVGIAAVLDFLDGFAARALKQHSPIGKDLDSLADMVTFGVVPGVIMLRLLEMAFFSQYLERTNFNTEQFGTLTNPGYFSPGPYVYLAFAISLFSALRLAKFNNDTRQSDSFIGVPTPANAILIASLPLILNVHLPDHWDGTFADDIALLRSDVVSKLILTPWVLFAIIGIMSYLLIAELPLFALKFKSFKWKGNEVRYSFLLVAIAMLVLLKFIALPLIIVVYIVMSAVLALIKRNSSQS